MKSSTIRKPLAFRRVVCAALTLCLVALSSANSYAAPIADSFTEWSVTGTQGENSWFNGYYNLSTDPTPGYSVGDVTLFTPAEWNGSFYDLNPAATGPWTEMAAEGTHPNGTNSAPGQEHWTVRRWVADATAPLALQWHMRKTNLNGGGVGGLLFVNGVQVDASAIAGNNGTGINRTYYANINAGDVIDLALTPNGDDGADGSAFRLTIDNFIPANASNPVSLANSGTEWSFSGTQGENGWYYGYYDQRLDVETDNGTYDPGDMQLFMRDGTNVLSATNSWDGGKYDLEDNGATGNGPWTELTQGGGHPAANAQGDPSVHWAVRRWLSDVDGEVEIEGQFINGGAGDGIRGRIFQNGVEVFNGLTDGVAAPFEFTINVASGDVIDFAADPDGAVVLPTGGINAVNDGSDGFSFNASIQLNVPFVPIPEPSSVVIAAIGGIGLLAVARRRRKK